VPSANQVIPPPPTGEIIGGHMIQNYSSKVVRYICGKCSTIFAPYGGKIPEKCPKCGCPEFEEMVKTKTEVIQK